ncbi:MAG: radical SAM protein, partial [Deltaproteobacteria bacterium]|nr:radical SAM protein [Deltaproteobacteria bacterium]
MTAPGRAACTASIRGRRLTVILKASDRCNGACAYCSVGPAGRQTMSGDAFETLARELERLVDRWELRGLNLTFHGGEPTLLGPRFIDRACRRLRRMTIPVGFMLQSNLLKVTAPMVEVIRRYDIMVGTSFDPLTGRRRLADGSDAYQRWRRSYLALAAGGIAPGAIFVVTRPALGRARELFAAADGIAAESGRRFGIQLNPIYGQGRAAGDDQLLVTPEEFGQFMVDAWTIWEASGRRHGLAPIGSFVHAVAHPRRRFTGTCSFAGNCAATHVGIDHALNVAGCGRRLDSKAFLGNLGDRPLVDILETSEERRLIATRSARLGHGPCQDCRFFALCHGGCPDDAAIVTGDVMARFGMCAAYRRLLEAITERHERAGVARPSRRVSPPPRAPAPPPAGPPRVIRLFAPGSPGAPGAPDSGDGPAPAAGDAAATAGPRETWLLAAGGPGWLEFDGALARVVAATAGPIRLWLPNRRVPALALWQDVARR